MRENSTSQVIRFFSSSRPSLRVCRRPKLGVCVCWCLCVKGKLSFWRDWGRAKHTHSSKPPTISEEHESLTTSTESSSSSSLYMIINLLLFLTLSQQQHHPHRLRSFSSRAQRLTRKTSQPFFFGVLLSRRLVFLCCSGPEKIFPTSRVNGIFLV